MAGTSFTRAGHLGQEGGREEGMGGRGEKTFSRAGKQLSPESYRKAATSVTHTLVLWGGAGQAKRTLHPGGAGHRRIEP